MAIMARGLIAFLAFALAAPAAAAGFDVASVTQAARKPVGVGAPENTFTVTKGDEGSTAITVTLPGGLRYILLMDQCSTPGAAAASCERLGFILIYNQTAGNFSFETMNVWNAARPPQAFVLNDGRTFLVHYMLAPDGVSIGNLDRNFEFWNQSVIGFNNYLANAPKGVTVNAAALQAHQPGSFVGDYFAHESLPDAAENAAVATPD